MTRQSRLTGRALGASALLCLSLALSAAIGPAAANKVGVAAAVNPDAFSSLSGAPKSQLNIGKSIFYNERIATTTSGLVQVLLVDGSTFTVGPDSDLVIDKFVKVKTPAGALTVRGGIALIAVQGPNRAAAALVFGDFLALARGGRLDKLRPGNMFVVSGPGPATKRVSTAADINALLAAVSGQKTKFAGTTPKGKPWPKYYGVQPTGAYPDEPFIKELYYSNASTGLILSGATRVPPRMPPTPPPPQEPPTRPPVTGGPSLNR